uniref:Slit n=1 Tax=Xenoturbella bocki TaxID=242395 RepID=A0A2P1DV53_XENBC|nr:slit [Xenoturbella bocki]
MHRLETLRLASNNFACDCHLSWMARWLRVRPRLGLFTRCSNPTAVRNRNVAELNDSDFECTGEEDHDESCRVVRLCPEGCTCLRTVVDCRGRGLHEIPYNIGEETTELRLEQNFITMIPGGIFSRFKRLRRIDMSNNQISEIDADAFIGLKSLTSLVIYGNRIASLPPGVFSGLTSLELLLLNANQISCIRSDSFEHLQNLNLLSLYDNRILSLANGTFASLRNLQTLHLARNPFICDCNMKWLAEYLHDHPIETSGARCDGPKRMHRKRIGRAKAKKFQCKGAEEPRTRLAGDCFIDLECPAQCLCEGSVVDCSGLGLESIPTDIPVFTTELKLNDNEIEVLFSDGSFRHLPNLQKIDLRNNLINDIETGAFEGAYALTDLLLTNNHLSDIQSQMFGGLPNLRTLMLRSNRINCITNETFGGLTSVRLLSLYDNQISTIMPGSFDSMTVLSTLNLLGNPFVCNCYLRWLSEWLRSHNLVTGNPRCQEPEYLRDLPIQDINVVEFNCDENNQNSCIMQVKCPAICNCIGTTVRCSRRSLVEFPPDIPLETTELYLDENMIRVIPPELTLLKSLTRLDLSHNFITTLSNNSVYDLPSLQTLVLSYNRIRCILDDVFSGLPSLRILSLHGNEISSIPDGTFSDLTSLSHIALGQNPLYCDCHLRWLCDMVKLNFIEPGIAQCQGPEMMADKTLLTAASAEFTCSGEFDVEVMAKCDPCLSNPCRNNATCENDPVIHFTCQCESGFKGRYCEKPVDQCFDVPCESGGTCHSIESQPTGFICECPAGFEGHRCEFNVDDCVENLCDNNSTCIDGPDRYTCLCPPGFRGVYCEIDIDYCNAEESPCVNGGRCVELHYGYRCECMPGFTGLNCSEDVDYCFNHQCQNEGRCIDEINNYRCICPSGYRGDYCEISPMIYPETSPCRRHECMNDALCYNYGDTYRCLCPLGFGGRHCEHLSSLTLMEHGAFVQMDTLNTRPTANITMIVSTVKANGILFYTGVIQHLAAELYHGRVRVSYDIGNYPPETLFSDISITDGEDHVVEVMVSGRNLSLRIDNAAVSMIESEGERASMETEASLFVGGLPDDINILAIRQWHLRNGTSFNGCIKEVLVNSEKVDFTDSVLMTGMAAGCTSNELPDPCQFNMCEHGQCRPLGGTSYACDCDDGWSGSMCEHELACEGHLIRDFVRYNGCVSRRKVESYNCDVQCGTFCCRARKTKKRRIRLQCEDGSSFRHQIQFTKTCQCGPC